jgi:hypothetical protein
MIFITWDQYHWIHRVENYLPGDFQVMGVKIFCNPDKVNNFSIFELL